MGGWRHVLLLGFLIAPDALRPLGRQHREATAFEVPENHKGLLDVIVSIEPVPVDEEIIRIPITEPEAIGFLRLRSDRIVLFLRRIEGLTDSNRGMIDQVRRAAPTLTAAGRGPYYGEIAVVHSTEYNAVTVVPLAASNFVGP